MLDIIFWLVATCSSVTTCKTEVDASNRLFTVIMCTKPDNPIPENMKQQYIQRLVEDESGRQIVIRVENCLTV